MKLRLVILAFALQFQALASADAPTTDSDQYVIDSEHTHVTFHVERFGFAKTQGVLAESAGTLRYDPKNPTAARVSATVNTQSVWTGSTERDEHIRGTHWLNAQEFPELRFVSSRVAQVGTDGLQVAGDLTLWGQSRPVTFAVLVNKIGGDPSRNQTQALGFSATTTIRRSEFGHTLAAGLIGDDVTITIEALAHSVP